MKRIDIISTIGRKYLVGNIENDEFSYPKAFKERGLEFKPIKRIKSNTSPEKLDIRFVKDNITVLVETKQDFTKDIKSAEEQLSAYVQYEKNLTGNKTIAILSNTINDEIKVWRGIISDSDLLKDEVKLRTFEEYEDFYNHKTNNKEKVMQNTYKLNELLEEKGIQPKLRSQFVGTCLLALKNNLDYNIPNLTTGQINARIKEVLESLLEKDLNKAGKLELLNKNVLESQSVRNLAIENFRKILKNIDENILPFINDKSTAGQDLLNLFFITFNKYVGKDDKNQAFTPDHICDFMSKISGVNKNSIILDPCCGSGSFLVRAMTQALDDCSTEKEQKKVKKKQIFGIEYDENIYGLATTNMLIHSDGNSNIKVGNCFDFEDWIVKAKPTVILMNPPYNAQKKQVPKEFVKTWGKDTKKDPTKGFYFVKYIADILNKNNIPAILSVLLPVSCAIGSDSSIKKIKEEILEENTLDAVFTLPNEVFYPGASASACCMIFKIGKKHSDISNPDTFFGYYKDDGFKKKKNLGRIEQIDTKTGESKWAKIEENWLELYRNRMPIEGISAIKKVSGKDEWLCEAYMKTDYTNLAESDFEKTIRSYYAYLIKDGELK